MLTIYQPSSLIHTIVALMFYILMAGFAIYSFLALYALNRFGRSKLLSAAVSLLYLIIAASLFAAAQSNLNSIKF
ncbi:MAG: hypothetical protein HY395_00075 [Candidatus Doudnabacteria bacterium]|nr:hypothetical protein [Candidatus Doudnabacteria bacterium]